MNHVTDNAEILAGGIWSGRIILPNGPQPPAGQVTILARNHQASIVLATGALKQRHLAELGALVFAEAKNPVNNLVYLMLATPCGRLGGIQSACKMLRAAGTHAAIVCYLQEMAFGPALILANHCHLVFAHPSTQIGWLECQTENGEFDWLANVQLLEKLAAARPAVPIETYSRLVQTSITGEQAEAMGIVGGLKRSIFDLANIDPKGAVA